MMMTMILFNKQQHISMVSRQTIVCVRLQVTSMWTVLTAV